MTPQQRGLELRQAINESIREGRVSFEQTGDNRWVAEVSYQHKKESIRNDQEFGWRRSAVCFEVFFTPDQLDYNGCHVYNLGVSWRIDWKTYKWAVRTLSEYMVMQKLES